MVLWGKSCEHSSPFIYDGISFILSGNEDNHKISNGFKFGKIGPGTEELAALERLEKSQYTYNGRNIVITLVP